MKPAVKAIVSFTSDRLKEKRIIKMAKSDSISIYSYKTFVNIYRIFFQSVSLLCEYYHYVNMAYNIAIIAWIIFLWKLFETK